MSANLKRGCGILLIASFVILSILALLPDTDVDHDEGYISSELNIQETVDGSVTSTSYVNPDGVITDAIDMGYATVCRMRGDNGRVVKERYLDASGNPVARYGDYYGLSYEYDETSTVITYLDAEGNPIIRSDGYSTIVRTPVAGRASDDFYYDLNGQQVQCSGGYYGLHCEFNTEGQNTSLTFLDKVGHAVCISSGYASKTYQRDGNGTVVGEQYFDTEGNPVRSSLGQYGEFYQRNEQGYTGQITYLDLDGNPAPTNAGYTILKRSGKVNLLLDRNGNVMLSVDNLLNGFPCMVVVFGCVVCLLMIVKVQMVFIGVIGVAVIGYPKLLLSIFNSKLVPYDSLFLLTGICLLFIASLGPVVGILQMTGNEKIATVNQWVSIIVMIISWLVLHNLTYFVYTSGGRRNTRICDYMYLDETVGCFSSGFSETMGTNSGYRLCRQFI